MSDSEARPLVFERYPLVAGRSVRCVVTVIVISLMLAACRQTESPTLVIPTLAPTAATNELPAATLVVMTSIPATAILPPPPTVAPATPTAAPATQAVVPVAPTLPPTTVPVPTESPSTVTTSDYQIAFVAANDTLNVRSGPGPSYPAIDQLAPDATGINVVDDGQTLLTGAIWIPVETGDTTGWINSRFLTESVSRDEFCIDTAVSDVIADFQAAVATQDGRLLSGLVHPQRGLRLRHDWWNEEIVLRGEEITGLFGPEQAASFDWGIADGSGEPISGTFSEVMLPVLQEDLLPATEWACDEILHGPTAGMVTLPDGYQQVHFFSASRPAPATQEFDWGTWVIGVERWQGEYYLSYLVHYDYEI